MGKRTPFPIESNVPLSPRPKRGSPPGWAHALAHAAIGDSIFLADRKTTSVLTVAGAYGRGWATARTVEGGVRVWKIAEPPKLNGSSK